MSADTLETIVLLLFALAAAVALIKFFSVPEANHPLDRENEGDLEGQFRVVELKNGLFAVQKYLTLVGGWRRIENACFNTAAEAEHRKAELEAERDRLRGYEMKRVVN